MPGRPENPKNAQPVTAIRYVLQRVVIYSLSAILLFVSAGTTHWLRGWIYVLFIVLIEIYALIIYAVKAPEMLSQRGAAHPGVNSFDKVFPIIWMLCDIHGLPCRFISSISVRP
jgi:hypothetical protein